MKLSFACPASLKADLDRYAALHAQAYGETVDVAMLILHRLEAFIAGDRGQEKGAQPRPRRRNQWPPGSNEPLSKSPSTLRKVPQTLGVRHC
ncbi:DUF2274 domain-containing protein [Pseudomonas chlororaphis subsp. aurantiaca]|nr:DUF2274 domain-containing protein [Pseudomonas chlororaphis subsp. aurantiaca]